ncbi:MAG: hypothetical protein KJP17_01910 [Gammaproteobacteria bacterium]|nr:hypothetical protein [Gammaproteobacteria bacterium]
MMANTFRISAMALLVTGLSLALFPADARGETQPAVADIGVKQPRSFLFIGNSFMFYNDSMHTMFRHIARAADPENATAYRATSATISGAGLNWHDVESYFRPGALAQYSFVPGNEIRFNDFETLFDVVIMQDCSQCPVHPQLQPIFHEYAAKHSATVVKHGARPVFLMTWAYADKPEMTAQLAEQYTIAGSANDALVVPAGLAFAKARAGRPGLSLYQPDRRHPSPEGTYLAALTIYASIFRRAPAAGYVPSGIDAEAAEYLREIAWTTAKNYFEF